MSRRRLRSDVVDYSDNISFFCRQRRQTPAVWRGAVFSPQKVAQGDTKLFEVPKTRKKKHRRCNRNTMDRITIDTYNRLAKEYDEETKDFWERFPRTIIDKFSELVKGKVLDVGSGPGRDGLILKAAGLQVVCLDASKEMVGLSSERGLESVEGDFDNLPFPDDSFDGVWSYTALLHIPKSQINKPLNEIHRVLKRRGVFGWGMIEGITEEYRTSSGVDKPRLFSFYTKEELEDLLKKHGFEIVYFEDFQPRLSKYLNFISLKI